MHYRKLFLFSFLIFCNSIFAKTNDVTLFIAVEEAYGLPVDKTSVRKMEGFMKVLLQKSSISEKGFVSIVVKKQDIVKNPKLISQLVEERVGGESQISRLILFDHGNTSKDGQTTEFSNLGAFGPKGPNKRFKKIFDPILYKFSSKLHIAFYSCNTFCGSNYKITKRALALLDYFSARQEGSVFGSDRLLEQLNVTRIARLPRQEIEKTQQILHSITKAEIGFLLASLITISASLLFPMETYDYINLKSLLTVSFLTGITFFLNTYTKIHYKNKKQQLRSETESLLFQDNKFDSIKEQRQAIKQALRNATGYLVTNNGANYLQDYFENAMTVFLGQQTRSFCRSLFAH